MRILIVPSWYPTPCSPVSGIFVREQASALSRTHDVCLLYLDVLPRGEKRKPRRWNSREHGYREEIVEVRNRPLVWQFAYLLRMLLALRKTLREFRPDVIHCHVAVPAGWGVTMLRRLLRVPVVLTEHSSEFKSWMKRSGLRWMARQAFRKVGRIIAVSEGQEALIRRTFPRAATITVVPNMVNTLRFAPSPYPHIEDGYRLLFVGLLDTDQKGLHILLDAIAQLKQAHKLPLHLEIVGDGILRPNYEAQADRLGISAVVTFMGTKSNSEVARLLRESHALVLPSLHESQGLVVIESLASGRPVVATRCGGPEFLIDSTNGLVVEPAQPVQLAEAIGRLLTNLDHYDPYTISSEAAKHYSQDAVTASLTEIYREVQPQ
jgi:glycosyltransferase involved in cell wall biosynthesis